MSWPAFGFDMHRSPPNCVLACILFWYAPQPSQLCLGLQFVSICTAALPTMSWPAFCFDMHRSPPNCVLACILFWCTAALPTVSWCSLISTKTLRGCTAALPTVSWCSLISTKTLRTCASAQFLVQSLIYCKRGKDCVECKGLEGRKFVARYACTCTLCYQKLKFRVKACSLPLEPAALTAFEDLLNVKGLDVLQVIKQTRRGMQ